MRFHEVQRAPNGLRLFFWSILGFTLLIGAMIMVVQVTTEPETTVWDLALMVAFVVIVPSGLVLWLFLVRQVVLINADGVSVQQKGLMWKPTVFSWDQIDHAEVRPINAFGEFGGWGIRYGFGRKWGYILDGSMAIELTLRSGKPRVITVVDAEGAAEALRTMRP